MSLQCSVTTVKFPAAVCCHAVAHGRSPFDENGGNFNWLWMVAGQSTAKGNPLLVFTCQGETTSMFVGLAISCDDSAGGGN